MNNENGGRNPGEDPTKQMGEAIEKMSEERAEQAPRSSSPSKNFERFEIDLKELDRDCGIENDKGQELLPPM